MTDPAGKTREEFRDALGRLITVTDDPGGSLDYDTDYTYDPLGNLLTVDQGSQCRRTLTATKSPARSWNSRASFHE